MEEKRIKRVVDEWIELFFLLFFVGATVVGTLHAFYVTARAIFG
ncbi:MAG: hypothetical protein WDA07_06170 [Leucobacter sp.]